MKCHKVTAYSTGMSLTPSFERKFLFFFAVVSIVCHEPPYLLICCYSNNIIEEIMPEEYGHSI